MNVQFKGGLILIVLVAALYYVFPTFQAYRGGVDPQTIADKVNLGLDLQGGMYLDIEVQSDVAVEEIVRRTRDNLEDLLIDEQVDFIEVRQLQNTLVVEMEPGRKVILEESPFDRILVQFDESVEGDVIKLSIKPEEADRKSVV